MSALTHGSLTAPAFEAVEYELTKVEGVFDTISPYMGPGPEVDAAWDRLTWNTSSMCRISHHTTSPLMLSCYQ
jgi:hypothetical protein